MDYKAFENYPIKISGINDDYNSEITSIENFIIEDMAYTGSILDIVSILPYFVYHTFLEKRLTKVTALNGESASVAEFTVQSVGSMVKIWNIAAKQLLDICKINEKTSNKKYQSTITYF